MNEKVPVRKLANLRREIDHLRGDVAEVLRDLHALTERPTSKSAC